MYWRCALCIHVLNTTKYTAITKVIPECSPATKTAILPKSIRRFQCKGVKHYSILVAHINSKSIVNQTTAKQKEAKHTFIKCPIVFEEYQLRYRGRRLAIPTPISLRSNRCAKPSCSLKYPELVKA